MSLVVILKNVYSFIKLLKSCSAAEVSAWENESIDNALKWAKYCEQLYAQSEGKSYQAELDEKIQQLGRLSVSYGDSVINLKLLKDAQKLVYQRLLQNSHLKDASLQHLVDTVVFSSYSGDVEQFLQTSFELCEAKSNMGLSLAFQKEASNLTECPGSRASLTDFSVQSEALILLQHILHSLKYSKDFQRTEDYIHQTLQAVAMESTGMRVLLHCLLVSEGMNNQAGAELSQNAVLKWILQKLQDEKCIYYKKIWLTEQDILCRIAKKHFQFFVLYLKHLISLEREAISDDGIRSVQNNQEDSLKKSYNHLLSHFRCLLSNGDDKLKSAIKAALHNLFLQNHTSTWSLVITDLQKEQLFAECDDIS